MEGSRRLAFIFAVVLAAMAALGFVSGAHGFGALMRINADTAAVHAGAAVWGFIAARMGRRASNLFLVSVGLLFLIDAFMGFTRGAFYLSFEAMRGELQPMTRADRFMAVAPHIVLGAIMLFTGLRHANAEARDEDRSGPAL